MADGTMSSKAEGFCSIGAPLLARFFSLGPGRLAIRFVLGQQQLAQYLQVAAQDPQTHVTLEALFALVAATLQTVPGLQGFDRCLYPRVVLPTFAKCHGRSLLLSSATLLAFFGYTRMTHD